MSNIFDEAIEQLEENLTIVTYNEQAELEQIGEFTEWNKVSKALERGKKLEELEKLRSELKQLKGQLLNDIKYMGFNKMNIKMTIGATKYEIKQLEKELGL